MDLFKDILSHILVKEEVNINFPNLRFSAVEIVEIESSKHCKK